MPLKQLHQYLNPFLVRVFTPLLKARERSKTMKKSILKLVSCVLSLLLLFGLAGCSEDKEAKERLSQMFDTLKEGEYIEAVSKYVAKVDGGYDFLHCGEEFSKEAFPAYDMYMAVFESLEYDIKETKIIDETQLHYITDITTIDLSPVGEELAHTTAAYNIAAENAEEDEKLSDSELNEILTQQMVTISSEYLEGNDLKTRTTEVEVIMYYDVAAGWMVYIDEKLADALSGGVYETFYAAMSNADMVTK